jgi:hypothetical protein
VLKVIWEKLVKVCREYKSLFQAFWVALSFHVVLFPILWIMGWALPWPRSPIFTTIVEYDLRGWPNVAKPKKVFQIMDDGSHK